MSYANCLILPEYYCSSCPVEERGRIYSIAYTAKAASSLSTFDPTSTQDWYDLICNGYARVLNDIRGSYDGSTAVEGPGFGSQSVRLIGRNHQLTYMDIFDCDKIAFYNEIANSNQFEVWFRTETKLYRSTNAAMVFAALPIAEDMNTIIDFSVTVKWSNKNLPICYDLPTSVFDSCESLTYLENCLTCNPVDVFPC